eukprot:11952009-Alexandrium_andersonii.AAC.1
MDWHRWLRPYLRIRPDGPSSSVTELLGKLLALALKGLGLGDLVVDFLRHGAQMQGSDQRM